MFRMLTSGFWACRLLTVPLILILAACVALLIAGQKDAAFTVSYGGTGLTLFCVGFYIVAVDSRSRWPNSTWLTRLGNLLGGKR